MALRARQDSQPVMAGSEAAHRLNRALTVCSTNPLKYKVNCLCMLSIMMVAAKEARLPVM